MKRISATVLLATPLLVQAVCLNPFGCEPKTYEECASEATKRPTDAGVRIAISHCYAKFRQPEEDKRRAEEAAAAQELTRLWSTAWTDPKQTTITAESVERVFGQALLTTGPSKCSGKSAAPTMCRKFYWADLTKAPVDYRQLGLGMKQPAFYAEFLVTGQLWHRGGESVPIF